MWVAEGGPQGHCNCSERLAAADKQKEGRERSSKHERAKHRHRSHLINYVFKFVCEERGQERAMQRRWERKSSPPRAMRVQAVQHRYCCRCRPRGAAVSMFVLFKTTGVQAQTACSPYRAGVSVDDACSLCRWSPQSRSPSAAAAGVGAGAGVCGVVCGVCVGTCGTLRRRMRGAERDVKRARCMNQCIYTRSIQSIQKQDQMHSHFHLLHLQDAVLEKL